MKQTLLILCLLVFSLSVQSSHFAGGNIAVKYDSTAQVYKTTLTIYRAVEPLVAMFGDSLWIKIGKESSPGWWNYIGTKVLPFDSTLFSIIKNDFDSSAVYVYSDTISLQQDNYRFEFDVCCMNSGVTNVQTPSGHGLAFHTDLSVDSLHNSAPDYLMTPVTYLPIGQTISYNSYPYDQDGDSIRYSFDEMKEMGGTYYNVDTFITLVATQIYDTAQPYGPITLNSFTGEITWTPNTIGKFAHGSVIKEYKNGIATGQTIRDQEYIVVPGNSAPFFNVLSPYSGTETKYVQYNPGQPLVFNIDGLDGDSTYPVTMKCYSTLFNSSNPPTYSDTGTLYYRSGTFSWTPPLGYHKTERVVFRVKDSLFTNDFTLVLSDHPIVGIHETQNEKVSRMYVYPNPSNGTVTIDLQLKEEVVGELTLYAITGHKIQTIQQGMFHKGSSNLELGLNVPAGMYFMCLENETGIIKTVKMMVE